MGLLPRRSLRLTQRRQRRWLRKPKRLLRKLSKRLLRKLSKRLLQNAMSQRTEDAVNHSITLSAQPVGVQDGIGAVLQLYTKKLTKLLLMPKNVALRKAKRS